MSINFNSHPFLNIPEFKKKTNELNTNWDKLISFVKEVREHSKTKAVTQEDLVSFMNKHFGRVSKDFVKFFNTFTSMHQDFNSGRLVFNENATNDAVSMNKSPEQRALEQYPELNVVPYNVDNYTNNGSVVSEQLRTGSFVVAVPKTKEDVDNYTQLINETITHRIQPYCGAGKLYGTDGQEHLDNINIGIDLETREFMFYYNRKAYGIPFSYITTLNRYLCQYLFGSGSVAYGQYLIGDLDLGPDCADKMYSLQDQLSSEGGKARLGMAIQIISMAGLKGIKSFTNRPFKDGPIFGEQDQTYFNDSILPHLAYDKAQIGPYWLDAEEKLRMSVNNMFNFSVRNSVHSYFKYSNIICVPAALVATRMPTGIRDYLGIHENYTREYVRGKLSITTWYRGFDNYENYRHCTQDALNRIIRNTGNNPATTGDYITDGFIMDLETLTIQRMRGGTKRRGGYHNYNRLNGFWSEDGVNTQETKDKNGNDRLYFGIEIETEARGNANLLVFIADHVNHNYPWLNNWLVPERDGSIRDGGIEWVATPTTPIVAIEMARLFSSCAIIRDCMNTTAGCGNHIHCNRRYFTATSFAKFFRFIGGDTINREFIEFIAERKSDQWSKMFDKKLTDGELIHKAYLAGRGIEGMSVEERIEYDRIRGQYGVKHNAINVLPPNTYECRIFHSQVDERLVKNIQFMYAAIRFATYVHRCKLSSGDFIKWLYRWKDNERQYPKDTFKELCTWLANKVKAPDDEQVYDYLLNHNVIKPATPAANVPELEKKEKEDRERIFKKQQMA